MVEANDTLTVTDGDTTEECTVLETYTYYGDEVAEVEGETLVGFVVAPEGATIESPSCDGDEVEVPA